MVVVVAVVAAFVVVFVVVVVVVVVFLSFLFFTQENSTLTCDLMKKIFVSFISVAHYISLLLWRPLY